MPEFMNALLPYKGVIILGILVLGFVVSQWIQAHTDMQGYRDWKDMSDD